MTISTALQRMGFPSRLCGRVRQSTGILLMLMNTLDGTAYQNSKSEEAAYPCNACTEITHNSVEWGLHGVTIVDDCRTVLHSASWKYNNSAVQCRQPLITCFHGKLLGLLTQRILAISSESLSILVLSGLIFAREVYNKESWEPKSLIALLRGLSSENFHFCHVLQIWACHVRMASKLLRIPKHMGQHPQLLCRHQAKFG